MCSPRRRLQSENDEPHGLKPYNRGEQVNPDSVAMLRPFDGVVVPTSRIARMERWVSQHINQLNNVNLAVGFTYLVQRDSGAAV